MRWNHVLLTILLTCPLQSVGAVEMDLLVASKDAPLYELSNFRTELDSFGNRVVQIDFTRTRQGSGTVAVRGRSKQGFLAIAAAVPSSVGSGTIQLKSFLPNREQRQFDVELFLVQTHTWHDGKSRYAVVSNSLRYGDPGPSVMPRPWTPEEEAAYENYKRIMADDSAQKPRKSYPASIDLPDDSQFVPEDAKVVPGTPLEACYSEKWHPLTALSENKDGSINVRWDAFGPSYDCSMLREDLIIKKAYLSQAQGHGRLSTRSRAELEKSGVIEIPPKPRKGYPVSISVPNHSQVVPPDLKLKPGTRLQACYAGKWNPITTLSENKDGSVNVRWDDYGPAFDCSMIRDELIIRKSVAQSLRRSATEAVAVDSRAPEWRTWTDATGKFSVRATLVRKSESSVTLRTEAGREVSLPLSRLSKPDIDFVNR